MKKVAVTGGLSCGKSSVCRIFQKLGAHVVSADAIVHRLLSPHHSLGQEVTKLLGVDIVIDGKIDRTVIGKKVFADHQLLHQLEALVHPAVRQALEEEFQRVGNSPAPKALFVAEIPLLFESGSDKDYDVVIAVIADEGQCRKRFLAATGYGDEEFDKRMSRQFSQQEKARLADEVITNDGNLLQLKSAVQNVFKKLTRII